MSRYDSEDVKLFMAGVWESCGFENMRSMYSISVGFDVD